jgi:hypothetical protein
VQAKLFVDSIDAPLVATPGVLKISPGTIAAGGLLYGGEVLFGKPDGARKATLGPVYYFDASKTEDGTPEERPAYADFVDVSTHTQRLAYAPRFPRLNEATRRYYRERAAGPFAQLSDGDSLNGVVNPPSGGQGVYFAEGDLHLGQTAALHPQGFYVVYVQGNLFIHRSVIIPPGAWVVFLVENDIVLSEQMPSRTELVGTYMANGTVRYGGPEHATGSFQLEGSLLAGGGFDLARGWPGIRLYRHATSPPGLLPLPHFTSRLEYRILQGKY